MMNEKDKALAREIATAWFEGRSPEIDGGILASVHSNPRYVLSSYIEYAMEAAGKEARAAVFKDAIQIAKEEAFERRLAHTVYERLIEAAASTTNEQQEQTK